MRAPKNPGSRKLGASLFLGGICRSKMIIESLSSCLWIGYAKSQKGWHAERAKKDSQAGAFFGEGATMGVTPLKYYRERQPILFRIAPKVWEALKNARGWIMSKQQRGRSKILLTRLVRDSSAFCQFQFLAFVHRRSETRTTTPRRPREPLCGRASKSTYVEPAASRGATKA